MRLTLQFKIFMNFNFFLFFSFLSIIINWYECKLLNPFKANIKERQKGCISFMIPTYNKFKYLNRCITSILLQNYECVEIIIINDGSTDKTSDLLKFWRKKDNRIITETFNENRGLIAARIKGVLLSYFDYLHPIDPDDKIVENSLEKYICYALTTNADIVQGKVLFNRNDILEPLDFKPVTETLNKSQLVTRFCECKMNWNMFRIIKRKVFLSAVKLLLNKFFVPVLYAEDMLFMSTIILYSNNFSYYPEPVYIYYMQLPDNSNSNSYKKRYSNSNSYSLIVSFVKTILPNFNCPSDLADMK